MNNPFLQPYKTPFGVHPFDQIENSHFIPAIEAGLEASRKDLEIISENPDAPTFQNTIEALENCGELLGRSTNVLFNLNSAETSDEIQQIAREVSPGLSAFDSEIKQNVKLWERIKTIYLQKDQLSLDAEQLMLLTKTYKSFVRSGADLNLEQKARLKDINMRLSDLTLSFGENLLAETNSYQMLVTDEADLAGLPQDVIKRAAATAKEKEKTGWVFTLQAPSYMPFMEYADNRSLREQLYKAYMSKALKGDEHDNQAIVKELVQLRAEQAELLGYTTYATYVLEERMAEKPEKVHAFLDDLIEKSLPKATEEVAEMKSFMKSLGVTHHLEKWDWAYYSEKLRKQKYDLDDELTKPYFQLENVIDGAFKTAEKLYGISFVENPSIPVYHKDVKAYEVHHEGEVYAIFFADFFPRDGKRGGAWMTSFQDQKKRNGVRVIPHISIVCNFTPSSPDTPSLLKFDEVETLFHEFGHALHGMLADTTYESLSGTHVYWDFVELPSQIMENWCYEKECLDLFARHYQTGELIPETYIQRLRDSATYHEAYATVRQLSFGLLDLGWHHLTSEQVGSIEDVKAYEQQTLKATDLFETVPNTNMSVQFGHIFAGGYAAGYYSYKWAEVLDADAFSVFKEKGVFDPETAKAFKEFVLSKGGTAHPMELYKKFRGQEPSPEALLQRAGLSQ